MEDDGTRQSRRRYKWPWFLLAAILLGLLLAIIWMSAAIVRIRQQRDTGPLPGPATEHKQ